MWPSFNRRLSGRFGASRKQGLGFDNRLKSGINAVTFISSKRNLYKILSVACSWMFHLGYVQDQFFSCVWCLYHSICDALHWWQNWEVLHCKSLHTSHQSPDFEPIERLVISNLFSDNNPRKQTFRKFDWKFLAIIRCQLDTNSEIGTLNPVQTYVRSFGEV